MIQTVKRTLSKCKESDQDPYLSLLILNTTPNQNGDSPASVLLNRRLRTNLPTTHRSNELVYKESQQSQESTKSTNLKPLQTDTTVRILSNDKKHKWNDKRIIIGKNDQPRSYDVLKENGRTVTRNRNHLIPTQEQFDNVQNYDDLTINDNQSTNEDTNNLTIEATSNNVDENATPVLRTRSGRIVKKPERYTYSV